MKILHLVPTLSAGGAETFVTDLAVTQRTLGHDVDIFLLAGVRGTRGEALRANLEAAAVECFGVPPRSARSPLNAIRLLWRIVSGRYDVIHAHLFSIEIVLVSLIPILSVIGARPLLVRTLHNSNIYGTRSRVLTRLLARAFDWNFACGRQVLKNYTELFGSSRSSLIENGVTTKFNPFNNNALTIRQKLEIPANAFVISCIGAFRGPSLETSQKAQDVALRAFHLAFGNQMSAHLIFAGDGELRAEAEALTRELGINTSVHFLGNLADIQLLLKDTDLVFMPSRYEGLPIVGLEAGCAGVPLLASSVDELLELGSLYGWVFSKDNTVEDFARHLSLLRDDRIAVQSRAKAMSGTFRGRYSINRCAREYLTEIQRLLDHLRSSSRPLNRRNEESLEK